jgi:hypothetical protein
LVRRLKMDQKQIAPEKELTTKFPVLYVAFELGNNTWKREGGGHRSYHPPGEQTGQLAKN